MTKLTEEQAINLLKKYSKDKRSFDKVLAHSKAVQKLALELSEKIKGVNKEYIKIGSLLHDIGRFESIKPEQHGIIGEDILNDEGLSEYSSIARNHLGAGISKEEVIEQNLPLPIDDYIPITKEEKIITHADNLIKSDKRISLQDAIERYDKELGKKAANKIKKLADDIKDMAKP
ncbi:MAG: HD domain-containing protein [Nanoarchaeota archaeon]